MSRKISEKIFSSLIRKSQYVVIKGFKDKPTKLKFINSDGKIITILCRDEKTQMNFANDVVCQYEAEGFKKLCEAFENADSIRLEQEWQKAKPIISS